MPGVKNKLYWKYERVYYRIHTTHKPSINTKTEEIERVYYRIHTIHKPSIYTKTEDAKTWRAADINRIRNSRCTLIDRDRYDNTTTVKRTRRIITDRVTEYPVNFNCSRSINK